jgi:hypothetical protein
MIYKLSEHNQILIALFAIVVLCSGKLFKDYLYRGGYIEGMGVTVETDRQFRRDDVNGSDITGQVTFKVTLVKGLPINGTIKLDWSGTDQTVTTSTDHADYIASPLNLTSPGSNANVNNTVTFTAATAIPAGTRIPIVVKNITINKGDTADANTAVNLVFTITSSNTDEPDSPLKRTVKILQHISTDTTQYVNPTTASIQEIKDALVAIQTRLSLNDPKNPLSDQEKENYLQMQTALTALMATTYGTVKEAGQVFDSQSLYEAQRTAIDFIKQEKERATSNAATLKQDNSNKRRMAQINTYYTKNYEANTDVMKNIIIVSVALIILAVLRNKKIIPDSIGTLGVIFILAFGGIVIGKQVFDIIRRNDHDFDKYDWTFNEDEMNNKNLLDQQSDKSNLSDMGMGMAACYGPGCCSDGTTWSSEMGKCLPNVGMVKDGTASWANEILTITFKVPSGLAVTDTVSITLPSTRDRTTLFTQKVAGTFLRLLDNTNVPNQFSISAPTSNWDGITHIVVAKTSAGVAAANPTANPAVPATEITIKINGLALNVAKASEISHYLTVKTSKDTNLVRIKITGI